MIWSAADQIARKNELLLWIGRLITYIYTYHCGIMVAKE